MGITLPETDNRTDVPDKNVWWELSLRCPCGATGVKGTKDILVCDLCYRTWDREDVIND
jgi:hypothetical protein